MSNPVKVCPICSASNPQGAITCWNCGTSLENVNASDAAASTSKPGVTSDFHYGETDLYEGQLYRAGQRYLAGCFGILILLMLGGLGLIFAPGLSRAASDMLASMGQASQPTPTAEVELVRPTVTPGPPTLTPTITVLPTDTPAPTPTRTPCMQNVQQGDTMYAIVSRCGHRSPDVFDEVIEINGLQDANTIQQGQTLEIPWPTPTPGAQPSPSTPSTDRTPLGETDNMTDTASNATSGDTQLADSSPASNPPGEATRSVLELDDEELEERFTIPTPTLPPGVQFHTVQPNESIIGIIAQYDASVEILSQLNPEVSFNQCDLGMTYGGERCNVMINQGQQLRVPAPSPTPTLSPTPSGSETPTPTPTPTFNAPVIESPPDRAFFRQEQLITLRWVPSAPLGESQTYRVIVEDRTAGIVYTADTVENSFIIPEAWQGTTPDDADDPIRHEYDWRVQVIDLNAPDTPQYETSQSTFTWETAPN